MQLDTTLGIAPNNTTFKGEVNIDSIKGITTSEWNPKTGGLSNTKFVGTQAEIISLANQCQTKGYEYKISGGAKWTIDVTYPVDIIVNSINAEPVPLTIWEFAYQQVDQNLYECKDRIIAGSLNSSDILAIDNKLRSNENLTSIPYSDPNNSGFGTIVYNLKKSGVEGRQKFIPILKRTIVTSNNNVGNISLNTGYTSQLFTTPALLATYNNSINPLSNMPLSITNQLPTSLPITYYPNGTATSPVTATAASGFIFDYATLLSYFVGWLQYPIEIQTISINKVQISQYWIFNQWSAGKYGLYDNANVSNNSSDQTIGFNNATLINKIPLLPKIVE